MKRKEINKMKGLRIDFTTNTIYISKAFSNKATIGSEEYNTLVKLKKDFPKASIVGYPKATARSRSKHLTYANMEKYIRVFEDSEPILEMFQKAKELSKAQPNPYLFVKDWFMAQFPNYQEMPSFVDGKLYAAPHEPQILKEAV